MRNRARCSRVDVAVRVTTLRSYPPPTLWLTIVRIMGAPMLDHLKANNRAWAERMVSADADFFRRLERQQRPEYLWIGCSDSRVPANEIVGLDPGELFVHKRRQPRSAARRQLPLGTPVRGRSPKGEAHHGGRTLRV